MIYAYLCYGILSAALLWFIFANIMQLKPYQAQIENIPIVYQVLAFIFVVGFIGDILWNIIFGSVLFYILDRWSGYDHKSSQGLPSFKGITKSTLYKLTLTARMKQNLLTRDYRFDKSYKVSNFICLKLLNPFDPNHCGADKVIAAFEA